MNSWIMYICSEGYGFRGTSLGDLSLPEVASKDAKQNTEIREYTEQQRHLMSANTPPTTMMDRQIHFCFHWAVKKSPCVSEDR